MPLKQLLKTKLSSEVFHPNFSNTEYKFLILDSQSTSLLYSVFTANEIQDFNIPRVEDISHKRQAQVSHAAIYLVTARNVRRIIEDFATPKYAAAYIYTLDHVSDQDFEAVKTSKGLAPYIKAFKELSCNFIVQESRVFRLYERFEPLVEPIEETVSRLLTVLQCLECNPMIR